MVEEFEVVEEKELMRSRKMRRSRSRMGLRSRMRSRLRRRSRARWKILSERGRSRTRSNHVLSISGQPNFPRRQRQLGPLPSLLEIVGEREWWGEDSAHLTFLLLFPCSLLYFHGCNAASVSPRS